MHPNTAISKTTSLASSGNLSARSPRVLPGSSLPPTLPTKLETPSPTCNCSSALRQLSAPVQPSPPRPWPISSVLQTTSSTGGTLHGLAGFLAYQCQAAAVARSKADGLRRHYGLDEHAISFWEHHAEVDVRHTDWAVSTLSEISGTTQGLGTSLRQAADAWWAFLDEREVALQAA